MEQEGGKKLPRPSVDAGDLEAVIPRTGIFSLALETSTDAVSVSFTVLPSSAVHASVVEIKSAALDRLVARRLKSAASIGSA